MRGGSSKAVFRNSFINRARERKSWLIPVTTRALQIGRQPIFFILCLVPSYEQ